MERISFQQKQKIRREGNDNYFEAVFQLRNHTEDQFHDILNFIEKHDCKITKHETHKDGGIDLYLFSQKFVQRLGKWLKDNYNCQITTTSTLHTRDSKENRDLYRVTVLAQMLKHKVGDVIKVNDEEVKITSIGKKPTAKVLTTGRRIFIDAKRL